MKKKITVILSLLIALVMCFALVACGNNTPSNGGKPNGDKDGDTAEKTLTYGKLAESLELITSGEGGYKATVSYCVNTKKDEKGAIGTLALEKRGSAVAVKRDENNYIANLDNGYVYTADEDGKYTVEQRFAGGMLDYALAVYDGGEADYDKLAEVKGYDKATKKLVFKYDIKDEVNSVIEPLINGYANNDTLYALVNTYIDKFYLEGVTIEDMFETGATMLVMFKDETVASLFEESGTSITDILVGAGIEVSEEFEEIIEKRTLGEALTGAFEYLDGMLAGGEVKGFDAEQLMYFVLAKEYTNVTVESLTASVDKYGEFVVTLLKGYTVKEVVDMIETPIDGIPAKVTDTLYAMITEGVKLTKAEINFDLTFDDEYRVTKLIAKADCAHSYTGESEIILLGDNDYHAEATLDISDYAATTTDFDIEFAANANIDNTVMYVADGSADAKLYIELAGKTATLNFTQVAAAERDTESDISYKVTGTPIGAAAYVSYDAATTTLTVRKAFFDELKKGEGFTGAAAVIGTITADGKQEAFTVYIDGISDQPAGFLQEIIKAQLETIMGAIGNQPDSPEISQAA